MTEVEKKIIKKIAPNGKLLYKYTKEIYIQKYLTVDELEIVSLLPGNTLYSKLKNAVKLYKKESTVTKPKIKKKKSKQDSGYKYKYKNKFFKKKQDLLFYIYSEEFKRKSEDLLECKLAIFKKYGKNYLKQFRLKNEKDIKRKIVEYTSKDDVFQYRNDNVKLHYVCKSCSVDVYTTYYLATHFNDFLCKHCRKRALLKQISLIKNSKQG